jgi:hypothetical protein
MPTKEDDRMVWLAEAQAIVQSWQQERRAASDLSITDLSVLSDRVATALQRAYERGLGARHA